LGYITEMLRTLQPGGVFLFQFSGKKLLGMNFKGRLAWKTIDVLWRAGLRRARQSTASLLGFDPKPAGRSWRGPALDASEVSQTISAAGASTVHTKGEGTPSAWAWGTKQAFRP
jgi:hypothetical protein